VAVAPSRFVRASIAVKFFGVVVVLLLLMALAAAISMWQARNVASLFETVVDSYMPAYGSLARANVRSLEEALLMRRVVIAHQSGGAVSTADRDAVLEKGKAAAGDVAAAQQLIGTLIASRNTLGDDLGLMRLDTRLEFLQRDLERLQAQDAALLADMMTTGDATKIGPDIARMDAMRNDVNAGLETARAEMRSLLEEAGRVTRAQQQRVTEISLVVGGLAALLGLGLTAVMTLALIRPVRRLLAGTHSVEAGMLDIDIPITSSDEIGRLTMAFNRMVRELREKARVRETFGKYLDPRIIEGLVDRPELLASKGERRVMTIFFSDMQGFTHISEGLTPASLVNLINRYLSAMSEPIHRNGGIIDKYIGDAVMAFWGPPFSPAHDQARLACDTGLEQLALLPSVRAMLPDVLGVRRHLPHIDIRIGIATGDVVVGNIGSPMSMSYTVMGDTVNLASRLEGASKLYGTRILVSEETMEMAGEALEFREIDKVLVVGKREPQRIFELLGRRGEVDPSILELAGLFSEGLAAYRRCAWSEAEAIFKRCQESAPEDGPTRTFLERIPQLAGQELSTDWDGVWRLVEK
jgi:adenylate cyclase